MRVRAMSFETFHGPDLTVMFQVDNNTIILRYPMCDSVIEIPLTIKEAEALMKSLPIIIGDKK